jgi:hypothetical protein
MNNDLVEHINKIRKHYASSNSKGMGLSNKYKIDCAKMVLNEIDINTLLESTILVIPDSHQLFFDYLIFKSFIIPDLYETIISYTINKIVACIQKYGKIEIHVNLNTLSVSSFTRYTQCIISYTKRLYSDVPNFPESLVAMHLYNIPSCIDSIAQLIDQFIYPETRNKMVKYDNISSEKAINTILEIIHITSSKNAHITNDNLNIRGFPIQKEEHRVELA